MTSGPLFLVPGLSSMKSVDSTKCVCLLLAIVLWGWAPVSGQTEGECRVAWGYQEGLKRIAPRLADAFKISRGEGLPGFSPALNVRGNLGYFATTHSAALFEVLIHDKFPDEREKKLFASAFPAGSPQAQQY